MKEKIRYSDSELAEFKLVILTKLEKAKFSYNLLIQAATNGNPNGTDNTSPTFKNLEEGSSVNNKDENLMYAERQNKIIKNLENALIRIQNKTYGICSVTGKIIPKERLLNVPHCTKSIEGKKIEEENERKKKNGCYHVMNVIHKL